MPKVETKEKSPKGVVAAVKKDNKAMKKGEPKGKPMRKEQTPGAVVQTIKDDERRWKAESALRDFESVERHKKDGMLMKDMDKLRSEKIDSLAKIKVETSKHTM